MKIGLLLLWFLCLVPDLEHIGAQEGIDAWHAHILMDQNAGFMRMEVELAE